MRLGLLWGIARGKLVLLELAMNIRTMFKENSAILATVNMRIQHLVVELVSLRRPSSFAGNRVSSSLRH